MKLGSYPPGMFCVMIMMAIVCMEREENGSFQSPVSLQFFFVVVCLFISSNMLHIMEYLGGISHVSNKA